MLSYFSLKFRALKCISKPIQLVVEPASVCNLKCPFCVCGNNSRKLKKQFMDFEEYKIVIDKAYPHIIHVALFLYGEPLLNKDILKMISYNSSKGILSTIHTNMNIMDNDLAEGLIKAGLFRLVFSAEGCTQATYEKYRIGGKIDTVFENIEIIIRIKKKLKKKNPIIAWKYLVNRYNEHEIKLACNKAKILDLDFFSEEPFFISEITEREKWLPTIDKYSIYNRKTFKEKRRPQEYCDDLWNTFMVDCEGDVYFCCLAAEKKENRYGNIFTDSVKDLWNSPNILLARHLVKNGAISGNKLCCNACQFLPMNFKYPCENAQKRV